MKNTLFILAIACAAFVFVLAVSAQAQTFSYVASFDGVNGYSPEGAMIQATNGNFYGVTLGGGSAKQGNVFEVTPSGTVTSIYSFCSQPKCADGGFASLAPILGSDGNLYGAAGSGGSYGAGTIYRMTLDGKITTLYNFCATAPCNDGEAPNGLTLASDGNFYGTATVGGQFNQGTIFKVSPAGKFTVLYPFCSLANCADGDRPFYPPIQGTDGNFYGTALGGGSHGVGVVYKLTPAGGFTVLHSFCSLPHCSDGSQPTTIVQDAKGNLFGTTSFSGSEDNRGTVFEITSTNRFIVLHSFDLARGLPITGLALANDGNLYGTTLGAEQGNSNGGTVFEITPAGVLTFLYTFDFSCFSGGYDPWGALFQGTNGTLYGTTLYGNSNGDCASDSGTIYSLSNGLSPLVETVPVAGKTGNRVLILGNGLTGTTSVTFNGVAAAFTVESDTYIKATVPAGATTGTVSVVTPSGTLNSNPQFVVTK